MKGREEVYEIRSVDVIDGFRTIREMGDQEGVLRRSNWKIFVLIFITIRDRTFRCYRDNRNGYCVTFEIGSEFTKPGRIEVKVEYDKKEDERLKFVVTRSFNEIKIACTIRKRFYLRTKFDQGEKFYEERGRKRSY